MNRARFGLDVLRAVRAAVPNLGVIYRVSVDDYFDGGLTYDEGRMIAIYAAKSGADAIHVTAGHYRSKPTAHRSTWRSRVARPHRQRGLPSSNLVCA